MIRKLVVPLVLLLAGCAAPAAQSAAASSGPTDVNSPTVLQNAGQAVPDPTCHGSWLRFSHPQELPAETNPWTVYLLADNHDPSVLVYAVRVMWVEGTASQHPQVIVGPGPQANKPTVKTVADCYGCQQMIARVKATTPQDCSEVTVLYPFDHSNGQ